MAEIIFSAHARKQMVERGASEEDVIRAIREGERERGKKDRWMYRLNIEYNASWEGKQYGMKQVAPVVAEEGGKLIVVTVYTFFF